MSLKKVALLVVSIVMASVLAIGCGSTGEKDSSKKAEPSKENIKIRMATASVGAMWNMLGGAMAEAIQNQVPGSVTNVMEGGGVANLMGIQNGQYEMGLTMSNTIPSAINGEAPYKQKQDKVRVVAAFYPSTMQIYVPVKSNIKSIQDLKGKNINPGLKGYTSVTIMEDILKVHGLSFNDMKVQYISTPDAMSLISDGHLDVIAISQPSPSANGMEMDKTISGGISLLSITPDKMEEIKKLNSGYISTVVKKGTYSGVTEDVNAIDTFTTLCVSADMPEEDVYRVTKAIFGHADKYAQLNVQMKGWSAEKSYNNIVGPIHPGAMKYYKEVGIAK